MGWKQEKHGRDYVVLEVHLSDSDQGLLIHISTHCCRVVHRHSAVNDGSTNVARCSPRGALRCARLKLLTLRRLNPCSECPQPNVQRHLTSAL